MIFTLANDNFIVWPSSVTLLFILYLNKCFKWQLCQIILKSMNKCRSYGPDELSLDHFIISLQVWPCLQPTWTNVSNGTSSSRRKKLCQIILKYMYKCRSYGLDKLNLWPFYHLTFKCDLDLWPTWTNVSTGTSTPQAELCIVILKSTRLIALYKLNLWPLYRFTTMCDFDLQPTWTNVSNGTSTLQGQQLCQITMHKCTSYGPDKSRRTHIINAHTRHAQGRHIHRTEVVTTMSRSLQEGFTKKECSSRWVAHN